VRDRADVAVEEKIRFTSSILPKWARRTKSLDALLPILYLRGVSTGDFQEALTALLGKDASNLSPAVITRLTQRSTGGTGQATISVWTGRPWRPPERRPANVSGQHQEESFPTCQSNLGLMPRADTVRECTPSSERRYVAVALTASWGARNRHPRRKLIPAGPSLSLRAAARRTQTPPTGDRPSRRADQGDEVRRNVDAAVRSRTRSRAAAQIPPWVHVKLFGAPWLSWLVKP
jgi:hypothetical protein